MPPDRSIDPRALEAAARAAAARDIEASPDAEGIDPAHEWDVEQPEEYREAWRAEVRRPIQDYLDALSREQAS